MITRHEPGGPTDLPPSAGQIRQSKYKKMKNGNGKTSGEVVIDPDRKPIKNTDDVVKEEKESTAVFTFGRFNPPTVGHEKLIHKVESVAREHNGKAHVFASHTENKSKDPLPQDKKIGYLKKVASSTTHVNGSSKETPNFLGIAKKLHQAGHHHLVMVAGSDRVDEYKERLHKYNGHPDHYNFKSIKVVSAGARDPDAEGVEGMSGTKMRSLARSGKHKEFKAGLPKALHPHAKEISDHIRTIPEEMELDEEKKGRVVTLQQRIRRGIVAKRMKAKLAVARKLARTRVAKNPQLKRRAQKVAKKLLRFRAAGTRGLSYGKLSPTEKIALDKMVKNKSAAIQAIAGKLMPRVKQREIQRLGGVPLKKRARIPLAASYEPAERLIEKLEKKVNHLTRDTLTKQSWKDDDTVDRSKTKDKPTDPHTTRQKIEYYRKVIESCGFNEDFMDSIMAKVLDETLAVDKTRTPATVRGMRIANTREKEKFGVPAVGQTAKPTSGPKAGLKTPTAIRQTEEKDIKALEEKAEATGIPFNILQQIYQRGMQAAKAAKPPGKMSPQQTAFARIASFISKGKSFQKEDADLAEELKKVKKQDPNSAHRLLGTTELANIYKSETPGQGVDEAKKMKGEDPCWRGYKMVGTKKKGNNEVPNCVPEERVSFKEFNEATYQGKTVPLNKPMKGDVKKSKVYVDPDGDGIAKKVNFGDKNMTIKKNNPARRKSFRARHNCDNPGPKDKARYWSCKAW